MGGFVLFEPPPDVLQPGMRLAELSAGLSAALRRFADSRWATDFGPVEPTPDVPLALNARIVRRRTSRAPRW